MSFHFRALVLGFIKTQFLMHASHIKYPTSMALAAGFKLTDN
jgi:hypothetical protein